MYKKGHYTSETILVKTKMSMLDRWIMNLIMKYLKIIIDLHLGIQYWQKKCMSLVLNGKAGQRKVKVKELKGKIIDITIALKSYSLKWKKLADEGCQTGWNINQNQRHKLLVINWKISFILKRTIWLKSACSKFSFCQHYLSWCSYMGVLAAL